MFESDLELQLNVRWPKWVGEKQCEKTEWEEDSGVTCRPLRPDLALPSRHGSAFKVLCCTDFVVICPAKASTHHKKRKSLLPTNVLGLVTSPVLPRHRGSPPGRGEQEWGTPEHLPLVGPFWADDFQLVRNQPALQSCKLCARPLKFLDCWSLGSPKYFSDVPCGLASTFCHASLLPRRASVTLESWI